LISGFEKLTLLNYPDKVACMVFTNGCNFCCPFCQNSSLITNNPNKISESEIFSYLEKRKNILEGVCISGGEPLLHKNIKYFIKRIKELGFKVKIDTNGSCPEMLRELISDGLVDYVAMDIKNVFSKYDLTCGAKVLIPRIKESILIIEGSSIDYEFRTTLVKEFHTIDDIKEILGMISNKSIYYLQNFVNSSDVIDKSLTSFTNEELIKMKEELSKEFLNVRFRDI